MNSMSKMKFKLAGGAKESHSEPIYCIAWSDDLHLSLDDGDGDNGQTSQKKSSTSSTLNHEDKNKHTIDDDDDDDYKKDEKKDEFSSNISDEKQQNEIFVRYMATCGSNHLTLYEVEEAIDNGGKRKNMFGVNNCGFRAKQVYIDADEEEVFYSCVFAGHGVGSDYGYVASTSQSSGLSSLPSWTLNLDGPVPLGGSKKRKRSSSLRNINMAQNIPNLSQNDGPQLCCVAGKKGIIQIIDTVRTSLLISLSGHGDEIYDMSVCPHDPWLLLSASKDESLRLWNIHKAHCIAIFAGHEGHRDAVLCVDWHPMGHMFVSSGMDESIKIWSLEGEDIKNAITNSREGGQERNTESNNYVANSSLRTVHQQLPIFSSSQLHSNYVDCVQFVGDLVLSKTTTNTIALWKPELKTSSHELPLIEKQNNIESSTTSISTSSKLCTNFLHLFDFECSECDVWYVRFGTDPECTKLAIGNKFGDIRVFNIGTRSYQTITNMNCNGTVRHVSFSPNSKSIIAVCDDSTLWKWDVEKKSQ